MVSPGEQHPRKRSRDQISCEQDEHASLTKRRKRHSSSNYPPEFWDTLSKVRLTRRALREFDRRSEQRGSAPVAGVTTKLVSQRLLRSDSRRIQTLASDGGPDLSALRGYSNIPTAAATMSKSSSQSRKRNHSSMKTSTTGKTTNTSPYDGDFEQKMIDHGIYPDGYEGLYDDPPEPENIDAIRQRLAEPRDSLSPSQFSEKMFTQFKRENRRAKSELQATSNVIPIIVGTKDRQYEALAGIPFYNMKKFDPYITAPTPDAAYGARTSEIDPRVRDDLDEYIIPSTDTSRPAAPNFFRADKSAYGRADVAQRQAMYDGAVGARGIFQLQNYGNATPIYDGNAYTISSTYHPGTGTLQMYATHPRERASGGGDPEYYTTQLDTYGMTGNINSFRSGAAAYRNAREWTQRERDRLIAQANAVALRMSTETRSTRIGDSNVSSAAAEESSSSDTSADELGADYKPSMKRRRSDLSH